jgi:hypothetical protein
MCTWQIGRTRDAREVLKTSMEKLVSDTLHKGVSPYDVMCWLSYVKSENLDVRGIELGFKWKPVKPRGGFTVANIYKDILSRDGNYVLTGVAKEKNAVWCASMTRLEGGKKRKTIKKVKKAVVKELSEERKLAIYALVADDMKTSKCTHAMGLQVRNGVGICFNNGYVGGSATFSVDNLAKQMIELKSCYVEDLYRVVV